MTEAPRPAGSHHGTPDLFETDVQLLYECMLWIRTARESGHMYGPEWLPGPVDFLKSRLFWRIRSGKQPLKHAPPRAYSCPWYELIEDDRPHWVWEELRLYPHGMPGGVGSKPFVTVAQSRYDFLGKREDGSLLLAFGPYHFKAWAGQQMVPAHVDGKDVQRPLDGWYIQYLKNVELT